MIRRKKATQAPHVPPETEQQPLAFARACQARERERERERLFLFVTGRFKFHMVKYGSTGIKINNQERKG